MSQHDLLDQVESQSFSLKLQHVSIVTHVVSKQLHDEGGNAAVDAYKDVDAGEDDVRCAGDLKEEGSRVHERSDGPPERHQTQLNDHWNLQDNTTTKDLDRLNVCYQEVQLVLQTVVTDTGQCRPHHYRAEPNRTEQN